MAQTSGKVYHFCSICDAAVRNKCRTSSELGFIPPPHPPFPAFFSTLFYRFCAIETQSAVVPTIYLMQTIASFFFFFQTVVVWWCVYHQACRQSAVLICQVKPSTSLFHLKEQAKTKTKNKKASVSKRIKDEERNERKKKMTVQN